MDRELLTQHLEMAERHVSQGERHIAQQRELIAQLKRGGHGTRQAIQLLRQFEELQKLHVADRDRLRKELSDPQAKSQSSKRVGANP